MTMTEEIREKLFSLKDEEYKKFSEKLVFTEYNILGVRQPELRVLAKDFVRSPSITSFLADLPHMYHEENLLHGYLLSYEKDFEKAVECVEKFLFYADNWAVTDCLKIKCFSKNLDKLYKIAYEFIDSGKPYTVRFGIKILMDYYLGGNFEREYAEKVNGIKSDEYYVKMMQAWYFATALAKNYDEAVKFIERGLFDVWVNNKAIQKARESFRVSEERKEYLKTLRR